MVNRPRRRALALPLVVCALLLGASRPAPAKDRSPLRDPIRAVRDGVRELMTVAQASVYLDVKPKDANVFVDDRLMGVVKDFNHRDHPLFLFPGRHVIEIRHPKYEPYRVPVDVRPAQDLHLKLKLRKI